MSMQISPAHLEALERMAAEAAQPNKIRTVVVDDVASMLEAVCAVLELEDVVEVVGRASNGAEAVAAVAQLHPELVLMDVHMPGMNGLEAARLIATQFPETRVALMSGEDSPELRHQCRASGADGFVFKRAFPEEFVPLVRELFPRRIGCRRARSGSQVKS